MTKKTCTHSPVLQGVSVFVWSTPIDKISACMVVRIAGLHALPCLHNVSGLGRGQDCLSVIGVWESINWSMTI